MTTTLAQQVIEQRTHAITGSDLVITRADDNDAPRSFAGHAAVFNSRTAIGNPLSWGWYEEIAPGTFTKTIQEGDARMLIDHDPRALVARVSAGDLRLAEDSVGLAVDADLDSDLSYVRDLTVNLERGRITGMSFGFRVIKDDWDTETVSTSDGQSVEVDVRTIREVQLVEVSPVTFPAYEDTDAGLRSTCETVRSLYMSPDAPGVSEPADATRTEHAEPVIATQTLLRIAEVRARGLTIHQSL